MEKPNKKSIEYLNNKYKKHNLKNHFFPNPDLTKYENEIISPE